MWPERSARTANSILCPNYLDEPVALIPPYPPRWNDLTLGKLKNIRGPAAAKLASDQGLTPHEDLANSELARARNLNMVLRHIGVSCAHLYPRLLDLSPLMLNPVLRFSIRPFHPGTVSF